MVKALTIAQLAERCRAEVDRYKQTRQANNSYCFELFHWALTGQDEAAWEAIYSQYQALVTTWVFNYSRFPQTDEEAAFFVNEAFSRMWRYGSRPEIANKLDVLGKCLSYLKLCVGSAIEDYLRRKKKDALATAVALQDYDQHASSLQGQVERDLTSHELSRVLAETIQDDRERLVAEETWVYDLAPRQIQARHPETFATSEEVSQIRRNLIKRLQRKLKTQAFDARLSA